MRDVDDPIGIRFSLLGTVVLGMGFIGAFACLASMAEKNLVQQLRMYGGLLVIAFAVGCFVGIISLPVILPELWGKQVRPVILRIYVPNVVLVIVWQFMTDFRDMVYFSCVLVALIGVCGSVFILRSRLPNVSRPRTGLCPNCSYDLRGDLTKGCPECGWNRPPV